MLKARGTDTIFGIPGVHNQEMYRGIEEAGITHVLARHEQGAGFMADGYARASGRPGVAYVITGPGLCNILTPLGQAYSDSVAVLAISSCLDETAARHGQLHQMKDQRAAAETVCDWSHEARTAPAAYGLIDRAFDEFATGRARPKHIQVPIAALQAEAPPPPERISPARPASDNGAAAREFADRLRAARRPLFVIGGGAAGAAAMVDAITAAEGVASFTTYAGRGIVAPDRALHFGSMLARPSSAEVIGGADMVVAIGTDLAEVDLWRETLGHDVPLDQINIDPVALRPSAGLRLAVSAESFLTALSAELAMRGPRPQPTRWSADEVAAARARWRAEVDALYPGIVPVCDALRACLPDGTMIYSDMTQFAYAAKEVWPMDRPGHWHHPFGFGTLGYALPAAIGGAVARRAERLPTLAIAGDYGFQYTVQELGVAVELGLPLPIILWDNAKLGAIEDSMIRAQIAPNAVIARNPDFCRLAQAWGAASAAPKTLEQMQDAVRAAFDADGPTLIRVGADIAG
jgi:acetolactate synthase-1/2/3 large subunit/5-guanidino-2-oxopentanoate decarboxylase